MSAPVEITAAKHGGHLFLRAVGWLSSLCGLIAASLILAAIGITCQMLYVRYWLGESTIWQTEMITFMMVGATLIGLPYVQRLRGHVNVDLIPLMLPRGLRKGLAILVLVASLVVMGLMAFYAFEEWEYIHSRELSTNSVWDPQIWPVYLTVPVGMGLFMLQMLADLIGLILGIEEPFGLAKDEGFGGDA